MTPPERPVTRGRPRTITRERIADVGIEIGLPNITFINVAAALGVSHMALYKRVPSLEELKRLVAEEIFSRWQIPQPGESGTGGLKEHLMVFGASVQTFVKTHPGVTPYVIRRLAATRPMFVKIEEYQRHTAEVHGISREQARWLLATVAFHCFAAADAVYSVAGRAPVVGTDRSVEESEMEHELAQGMQALVAGALVMLEEGGLWSGLTRFLDTSELPVARVDGAPLSTARIAQWIADIDALIRAGQAFVLVYEHLPASEESGDAEGRRKTVGWLKIHRQVFEKYCRGIVLTCEHADELPALRDKLMSLEKIYRVPVRAASSADETQAHVRLLMATG